MNNNALLLSQKFFRAEEPEHESFGTRDLSGSPKRKFYTILMIYSSKIIRWAIHHITLVNNRKCCIIITALYVLTRVISCVVPLIAVELGDSMPRKVLGVHPLIETKGPENDPNVAIVGPHQLESGHMMTSSSW